MLNFSKERVLEILGKGIEVRELASNPAIIEKAIKILYKSIPIPWRWFVGKKRIKVVLEMVKNKVVFYEDK